MLANKNEIYTQDTTLADSKPVLVNSGFFTAAYGLSTLDGFIYVTDETKGLYVIKTFDDEVKPFDPPVKIELGAAYKNLRALTVLTSSALQTMIQFGIFAMVSLAVLVL